MAFGAYACHEPQHADPNLQGEKIHALTSAANVELEPIWASLLAKALDGKDIKDLLTNVGGGGAAPAGAPAAAGGAGDAAAPEAKKEEKKEEAKEESDDDMVSLLPTIRPPGAQVARTRTVADSVSRASVSSTKRFDRTSRRIHLYLPYM